MQKMRDEAVAFDYPNNMEPTNYNNIYHTNMPVPKPTNAAAKITPAGEVMRAVLEAK